jgi:hypothetical protein
MQNLKKRLKQLADSRNADDLLILNRQTAFLLHPRTILHLRWVAGVVSLQAITNNSPSDHLNH